MNILIAEDELSSRMLLKKVLEKWNYVVTATSDGNEAWDALKNGPLSHVVVLDWMMPGMDGLELSRKIRADPALGGVYIVLLTANNSKDALIAALDAGADDYLTKPFNYAELRARIAVGVRISEYEFTLFQKNEELKKNAVEMEKLAMEKSKQLVHSDRMATVGLLSAGIAHEVNNPTSFISGNAQTMQMFWETIEPVLRKEVESGGESAEKLTFILDEVPKLVLGIRNGVKRISTIVKGLKSFCRNDKVAFSECDINSCIEESLLLCHNSISKKVVIEKELAEPIPSVMANAQQIEQVIVNLLINAVDAVSDLKNVEDIQNKVWLETSHTDTSVSFAVEDSGPGIALENLDKIWQPFFTTKSAGKGTGLGLPIVFDIVDDHKGKIDVLKGRTGGAKFVVTLPVTS